MASIVESAGNASASSSEVRSTSPLKICVFASSSPKTHEKFLKPAYLLGQLIARAGHVCLTGAGAHGSMGAVNSGARSENGRIMGVSHELFRGGDTLIEDKIICKGDDLAERRRCLLQHADLILVLPGGPGTFDELWETSVCKILSLGGIQLKPLCVINLDRYYDGTIAQLQRASEEGLLYGACEEYFHVEEDVTSALEWSLREYERLHALKLTSQQNGSSEEWANAEGGSSSNSPEPAKVFH